ncbi:MAG: hypothetical protein ACKV2T_35795 [Kofleriaceae bacterium]
MQILVLLGFLLVTGCQTAAAPAVTSVASPARATPPPVATTSVHAATAENLVGVWMGDALGTPFGDFRFAMVFDREPGGDIHARIQQSPTMYLDFRFQRRGDTWVLVEEGSLTGEPQTHTLLPIAGSVARWSVGEPAFLVVELAVDDESLDWRTWLSGTEHARFQMKRVRGDDAEKVRQAIARRASGGRE